MAARCSRTLRSTDRSRRSMAAGCMLPTSCCVMVLAPRASPPMASRSAPAMPTTSTPLCW
jgi:hypothetical protein